MSQNNKPSVVFESEEFQPSKRSFQTKTPKMVQWVIKYSCGMVKDEKQANYVLIGFVVIVVVILLYLISGMGIDIPQEALKNPEYGLPEMD